MKTAEVILKEELDSNSNTGFWATSFENLGTVTKSKMIKAMKAYAEQERKKAFKAGFDKCFSLYSKYDVDANMSVSIIETEKRGQATIYIQQNPLL